MGGRSRFTWFYLNKRQSKTPALVLFFCLVLLVLPIADFLYYQDRLYPGIYLKDINIGGKTVEELQFLLENTEIAFTGPEGEIVTVPLKEMGIRPDARSIFAVAYTCGRGAKWPFTYGERLRLYREEIGVPFRYQLEPAQLDRSISRLAAELNSDAQDARFSLNPASAGAVRATLLGEKYGFRTDVIKLATAIRLALDHSRGPFSVTVPGEKITPSITISTIDEKGITALMSSFATPFDRSNADRAHNMKLAAAGINNYFLAPGEVFSLNRIIGDTTPEKGYKKALTMQGGELVDGFGGGICQVSSTLYNAALLAGLEIVERHNHQMTVPYITPGRDATIVYGVRDLKFRNNREQHFLINGKVEEGSIRFSFFGPPLAENVIIYTRTLAIFEPWHKYEYTSELPPGEEEIIQGSPGYLVETWKYVYKNDPFPTEKRRISLDSYNPHPTIIRRSNLKND